MCLGETMYLWRDNVSRGDSVSRGDNVSQHREGGKRTSWSEDGIPLGSEMLSEKVQDFSERSKGGKKLRGLQIALWALEKYLFTASRA